MCSEFLKAHLRKTPSDSAGLLGPEVKGQVLLVFVVLPEILALLV
jgi:hypothetical protein